MAEYIEGKRPVIEALRTHVPMKCILMADNVKKDSLVNDILRKAKNLDVPVKTISKKKLDELSERESHQGVLCRFCAKYPDVQLIVQSGTAQDMFKALAQNDVDLLYHLDNLIYRSDLTIPLMRPEPVIFVASKDHPLAGKEAVPIRECLKYRFILTEKGMSYRMHLDNQLAQMDLAVEPFLEIGNTDVIVKLLVQNMGVSFLPQFVVQEKLESGALVRLDVRGVDVELSRQLICHKGKWITPAMQAMIDMLAEDAE